MPSPPGASPRFPPLGGPRGPRPRCTQSLVSPARTRRPYTLHPSPGVWLVRLPVVWRVLPQPLTAWLWAAAPAPNAAGELPPPRLGPGATGRGCRWATPPFRRTASPPGSPPGVGRQHLVVAPPPRVRPTTACTTAGGCGGGRRRAQPVGGRWWVGAPAWVRQAERRMRPAERMWVGGARAPCTAAEGAGGLSGAAAAASRGARAARGRLPSVAPTELGLGGWQRRAGRHLHWRGGWGWGWCLPTPSLLACP